MTREADFNERILNLPDIAERESGGRFPVFREMLRRYGGIGAAKNLLKLKLERDDIRVSNSGFKKLFEMGLKKYTVEALVVEFEHADIFTKSEIEIAKYRLRTGDDT
jgi:hypothetical protein